MRFGFVTAVHLGLGCLEEIYKIGGEIDILLTLRDGVSRDKSGRVFLDEFGIDNNIPLHKVRDINDSEAVEAIRQAELDWLFIIGWSQIARSEVLTSTKNGCIGMHPTLLPKGRGRASIPWAILKDLPETGVTMFVLDEGVDTGPIIAQETIPILRDETATTLYQKTVDAHNNLMRQQFPVLTSRVFKARAQIDADATIWPGRGPEDGRISADMTVEEVDFLVRATTRPYPGAFVETATDDILRIWQGSLHPSPGAIPIQLSNGTYWASETATE